LRCPATAGGGFFHDLRVLITDPEEAPPRHPGLRAGVQKKQIKSILYWILACAGMTKVKGSFMPVKSD
jgi:hypothetical protein